jgi:hypothetical protein
VDCLGDLRLARLRERRVLRWLHFASLLYGIFIETAPPYRGPFLVHYLDAVIYPNIPEAALVPLAAAVCAINRYLHARRFRLLFGDN